MQGSKGGQTLGKMETDVPGGKTKGTDDMRTEQTLCCGVINTSRGGGTGGTCPLP